MMKKGTGAAGTNAMTIQQEKCFWAFPESNEPKISDFRVFYCLGSDSL